MEVGVLALGRKDTRLPREIPSVQGRVLMSLSVSSLLYWLGLFVLFRRGFVLRWTVVFQLPNGLFTSRKVNVS